MLGVLGAVNCTKPSLAIVAWVASIPPKPILRLPATSGRSILKMVMQCTGLKVRVEGLGCAAKETDAVKLWVALNPISPTPSLATASLPGLWMQRRLPGFSSGFVIALGGLGFRGSAVHLDHKHKTCGLEMLQDLHKPMKH